MKKATRIPQAICILQSISINGRKDKMKFLSFQVIDLPDERPIITGANIRGYKVGDWLDVNCTSPKSKPPALLKWYINDEKPTESYVKPIPPQEEVGGLYTAKLRLKLQLKRQHFVQGHVSLKCTASIYSEYFMSTSAIYPGLGLGEKALESRRTNGKLHTFVVGLCHLLLPFQKCQF